MGGNGPRETGRYQMAAATGARWNRWAMYWDQIERSAGNYDWSNVDATVDSDREMGFETNAILLASPGFYTSALAAQSAETPRIEDKRAALAVMRGQPLRVAQGAAIAPPRGLYASVFADGTDELGTGKAINPNNVWARFVASAVTRYRDRVHTWEMWNEPDFSQFWSGAVADYARLLKVGYLAARSADPSARVLVGGMMYWEWTNRAGVEHAWLRAFLDEQARDPAAARNGYYFDGIPWHFYSRASDVYDRVRSAQVLLQQRGVSGKGMWINETNAPACGEPPLYVSCGDPNYKGSATVEEQADFHAQAYAYGLAVGLDRYIVFQYADDGQGESFGITRNDGSARPAYRALQVAIEQMGGATGASRQTDGNVERIVVTTLRGRVTAMWARKASNETGRIDAIAPTATLVERDGSTSLITPTAGKYAIALSGATANKSFSNDPNDYIIGGRVRMIVEATGATATPSPTATPIPVPLPTEDPGWLRSRLPLTDQRAASG
jgi:hypothetical protein